MNTGESNSLTPTAAGSGEKAELGDEACAADVVTQADWLPEVVVVQPAGNVGTVTVSKSSLRSETVL
jgi:hypothetical protein